MTFSSPKLLIIAPLLAVGTAAWADSARDSISPFDFNTSELDSIQYTRSDSVALGLGADGSTSTIDSLNSERGQQTEFSFKLKPKRPGFSKESSYGLGLFSVSDADVEVNSRVLGVAGDAQIPELNDGLAYSAGLRFEQEDADIDGTAYVSSSQLGLSYGRLGRLWYGGIDVNLEQFADSFYGSDQPDVLSLDVTTGRRLGFTGLTDNSPLWLLSVQGNFDMRDAFNMSDNSSQADWYLNPSLFWKQPGFTFSAQMQVPIQFETLNAAGEPDYRLRAVFEKQFK